MIITMYQALADEAARQGIVDTALCRCAPLRGVFVDNDGTVYGAEEAIAALRRERPRWFVDFSEVA